MTDYNDQLDYLRKISDLVDDNTYLSITDTDILCGNQSTSTYNNCNIWNRQSIIIYANNARMLFLKEFNILVKEFHIVQAKNTVSVPIPDSNGQYSWERILLDDGRVSQWVLTDFYPSKLYCSSNCCGDSLNLTRANSAFRAGLIQTLPEKIYRISNE